ncbi:MAG: Uma2 family endonuclease [Polyangiaceae bacterium]
MEITAPQDDRTRDLHRATVEEWLAEPMELRSELIDGRIIHHAAPDLKHGAAQAEVVTLLRPYRRGGAGAPGGWWMSLEVDLVVGGCGCRPDVVGWRRDKHPRTPQPDARGVVTAVPDFICEVLSPSTARYDQGIKRDAYHKAGVAHYWLLDPAYKTLTVLERADRGYVILLVAGPEDTVRAPPFTEVAIPVAELFLDEEEGPSERG